MIQGWVSVCASESGTLLPLADQSMLLKSWLHKLPASCRWGANELRLSACKYAADCFLFKHMTMHIWKSISLASQRVSQASCWFIDANTISLCLQALYTVCIQCKNYLRRTLYFLFFLTHNCIWYSFSVHLGLQMYVCICVTAVSGSLRHSLITLQSIQSQILHFRIRFAQFIDRQTRKKRQLAKNASNAFNNFHT